VPVAIATGTQALTAMPMSYRNLHPVVLLTSLLTGASAEAKQSASADVTTEATLVPTSHVEGTQAMSWSTIVAGQYASVIDMDRDGRRTKLVGDAQPIGMTAKPAKFSVRGIDDGVHVSVSATPLVGVYNPSAPKLQLIYLVAWPTYPDGPPGRSKHNYSIDYTVTGKLVLPPKVAPDVYRGSMTMTAQYF
jgi:hypothetical protein